VFSILRYPKLLANWC